MSSKIDDTLLEKLFVNPAPLDRKREIFFCLHDRMFPCKEIFIDFLKKTDASERLELAKYILQRLCFEANFPPPYPLLVNLLDFEKDNVNKSKSNKYVPQDHFSHIIYTYLLGLYFFFYSQLMNQELTKKFIRRRTECNFDIALDATKDFVSYWKYFCLYHDIAYPIECFYVADNKDKSTFDDKEKKLFQKYIQDFNKINFCLSREILLKGATKYLVVWQMLDDPNNLPFSCVLESLSDSFLEKGRKKSVSVEEMQKKYGAFKCIDKIHCFEHFKMLTGSWDSKNYISVLFDAFREQPIALKFIDDTGKAYYYTLKKRYHDFTDDYLISCLDHEDYMLDKRLFVRYYFKELKSIMNAQIKIGGQALEEKDYKDMLSLLDVLFEDVGNIPEPKVKFEYITTSKDLNTFMFQCYRILWQYMNSICLPMEPLSNDTIMAHKNNSKWLKKYLDNNFEAICREAVWNNFPFVDYDNTVRSLKRESTQEDVLVKNVEVSINNVENVTKRVIEELLDISKIEERKKLIQHELFNKLIRVLKDMAKDHESLVEYICYCNKKLFPKNKIKGMDVFREAGVFLNESKELWDEGSQSILREAESYLNTKKDDSINDFMKKYRTKYSQCDHGIYGACIYLLCFQFNENIINIVFQKEGKDIEFKNLMSTLCWNVESSKYNNKLVKDYGYIADAVFESIFFHNLYPKYIKDIYQNPNLEWKYDFLKEPTCYFAMLVDALQIWNREKYVKHSDISWKTSFSMDDYDITIDGNRIVLHIKDYNNDLSEIKRVFVNEKETYLKDFSRIVGIDVLHS